MTTELFTTLRRVVKWITVAVSVVLILVAVVLSGFRWEADRRETLVRERVAPETGRFVDAADVRIYIQETGREGAPIVLFIHGTGAWSETWRESMNAAANAGFRAVALDLPPFGYSQLPKNSDYGASGQAKRIAAVLDALRAESAVIVGHSFGGGSAMEAVFLVPERVRALVLTDVALGLSDVSAEQPSWALRTFLATPSLRNAVVATFLTNPMFTKQLLASFIDDPVHATPARVDIYRQPLQLQGTTEAVGEWLPTLLLPRTPMRSTNPTSYKNLNVPTLVVWGELDTITPPEQGRQIARLVPGAELVMLKNVGHIPQIEDASRFNELLVRFLSRLKTES